MNDDAMDAASAPNRRGVFARLAPKPSGTLSDGELRSSMRSLDLLERKVGWVIAAIPLLFAAVLLPNVLHNTKGTVLVNFVHGHCPAPSKLIDKSCVKDVMFTPAHFALEFCLFVLFGAVLLLAVWRSMRVLVIVASLLAGFPSGYLGLLSIFYGGWLLLRSWRLQRYGVVQGSEVRKITMERAAERRAAKKSPPVTSTATGAKPAAPSKRYTPKARPKKR